MSRFLALLLAVICAGCAGRPAVQLNESLLVTGFPGLPADAAQVAERLAACNHFAGEIGDNPPEREQEIAEAVTELHCDRIEQDVAAVRSKYAGNRDVEQALAAADQF